jgi:hypothetical protein
VFILVPHNHQPEISRIDDARKKGLISLKTISEAARDYDERALLKIELISEFESY